MQNLNLPLILSFNASDPVGASGLQADAATCASLDCHALSVTTALLVGDSAGIEEIFPVESETVGRQARALLEDMTIASFKVGTIGTLESVPLIAEILVDYPETPLILDPFSGYMPWDDNQEDDTLQAICELLVPQTTLLILREADLDRMSLFWPELEQTPATAECAARILATGCDTVLITGCGADALAEPGSTCHEMYNDDGLICRLRLSNPGDRTGGGSTFSAAMACLVALDMPHAEALRHANAYLEESQRQAHPLGMGRAIPFHHFRMPVSIVEPTGLPAAVDGPAAAALQALAAEPADEAGAQEVVITYYVDDDDDDDDDGENTEGSDPDTQRGWKH